MTTVPETEMQHLVPEGSSSGGGGGGSDNFAKLVVSVSVVLVHMHLAGSKTIC